MSVRSVEDEQADLLAVFAHPDESRKAARDLSRVESKEAAMLRDDLRCL